MATILPNQIIPITVPFLDRNGNVDKNWWLFFYNISQSVLGNSGTTAAAFAAQSNADLDADVDVTDSLSLVQRIANLEKQAPEEYVMPNPPGVVQDGLLQDVSPRAQPVQIIAVGGSPFTYTASFDGSVIVSGGSVSAVALSRDGSTFYDVTGAIVIPVSRLDQVKVTWGSLPNMEFFPR